jgi:hypothetical protein
VIDDKQLAEWQALADGATEGPWVEREHKVLSAAESMRDEFGTAGSVAHDVADSDARLIAVARTAVPALIAEVKRLRGEVDRLRATGAGTLLFYPPGAKRPEVIIPDEKLMLARREERERCAQAIEPANCAVPDGPGGAVSVQRVLAKVIRGLT